jgi:hypothetical protein
MSKRPIERPKTRWEDDVLEDIESMKVCDLKNVTQNWDRWKKVFELARSLYWLQRFVRRICLQFVYKECSVLWSKVLTVLIRDAVEFGNCVISLWRNSLSLSSVFYHADWRTPWNKTFIYIII